MILNRTAHACRSRRWPGLGALLAGLAWLAFAWCATAQVTVQTIGGGVRTECGSASGFAGGNTYETAQFHGPYATALDPEGNLWMADMTNNEVEEISLPGNTGSSVTTHTTPTTSPANYHSFTDVNAVALDANGDLYVLLPTSGVVKYQVATPILTANATAEFSAGSVGTAMVVDFNSNVFVAFASGAISRFTLPDGANINASSFASVVGSYNWQPAGMALCANGMLAVSDTLSNAIYLVNTNASAPGFGTPGLLAGANGAGYEDGNPAKFLQPRGLAASADGRIVVCDTGNNRVRIIDTSSNTSLLYGVDSNLWSKTCCNCSPDSFYAGWVDGAAGTTSNSAAAREPVSATIAPSGAVFVTELYYDLLRSVSGSGLTPVNLAATPPVVVTLAATGITATNATLNGTVNPGGDPTGYYFELDTTTRYGVSSIYSATNLLPTNATSTYAVSFQTLSNNLELYPGTKYYFQLVATNILGTNSGGNYTFTTPGLGPDVTTLPATNITTTSATLSALVDPDGEATSVAFQYTTSAAASSNNVTTTASTNLTTNLNGNQPVSITASNLQPGTTYYFLAVAGNGYGTFLGAILTFSTLPITPPPPPTFGPTNGYFPECVTISVTSAVQAVYYTLDGSTPSTNSAQATIVATNATNYIEALQWCNPLHDLSSLRLLAVDTNGIPSAVAEGSSPTTNLVGFPQTTYAGSGSTAYIPLVVELQNNGVLQSLQYRVEFATNGAAPAISNVSLQPITSDDFVQFVGPAPANAPVTYSTFAYTNPANHAFGLVIATEPGSGLNIQGFAVPVLLRVPIPKTAAFGQSYSLSVLYPSGTSDGIAASVGLTNMPAQQLIISNKAYMSGDSSPANGYNAGKFGSGSLDNSDANNILYALVGIRKPYADSDAFNPMDVFPETNGLAGFGEGHLVYLDWQITLDRSVGLNTNNWIRFWTNFGSGGVLDHSDAFMWTPGGTPVVLSDDSPSKAPQKLALTGTPPGSVWFCQASISAGNAVELRPGNTCSLPVYASVLPGCSLWGLDFRAVVTPNGSAPAVGQVQFNPSGGIPPPAVLPGLASNDIICAWVLGSFEPPLENSNYIGSITFQVPQAAASGQSYSLHFIGAGGAPDGTTSYQMESFPATACVGSAALPTPSLTSDDWKIAFFGSLTNPLAADDVDADGDGALNWQEYLAGTNPTNASSCLQFSGATLNPNGLPGVALNWLTAPGKTYIVESQPALGGANWTAVSTNSGDGNYFQLLITNYSGNARFYQIRLQP